MVIHFVLVEPAAPGNVGASARALKTMGFHSLRLVNPCDYLCDEAQRLAHASVDILKAATVFSSVSEALSDCDFVVGTTAKKRLAKNDYYPCHDLHNLLASKGGTVRTVAVLFGRECSGLDNTELTYCDCVSAIPMKTKYPSLNLSQAVMLYAYSLSPLMLKTNNRANTKVDESEYYRLKETVNRLMSRAKVKPLIQNRIRERLVLLGENDVHLLFSVCNRLGEFPKKTGN